MTSITDPEITIIIEWENVLLSEAGRALTMLARLGRQIDQSPNTFEVLVVFNHHEVDEEAVATALRRAIQPSAHEVSVVDDAKVHWRIEPVGDLHYYDIKNAAAQRAKGEIIVFLDSDVIPEAGWLDGLIEPMKKDPTIAVMAGHTYLDPQGLIGQAFALGWFFPLKNHRHQPITTKNRFFANNVAFRRAVFHQYPFPPLPQGVTRGACIALAKDLRANGVLIHANPMAQTSHPSPNGWRHLWVRAMATGRDQVLQGQAGGHSRFQCVYQMIGRVMLKIRRTSRKTLRLGHRVGLAKPLYPLAILFMTIWHSLAVVAAIQTAIAPRWASRRWRI